MRKIPWWVHPALLTAGLLYGANYSVAKEVMNNYLEPFGLNLLRVLTAFLIFLIFGAFKHQKIDRSDFPRFVICALFGASLNVTLFLKGLSFTTPVNAALILTTSPIIVLIASYFLLKEKITLLQVIGITLGLTGAIFLLNTNEVSFSNQSFLGDVMVLVNTVFYSLYLVLVKPLMVKYHPFTILKWIFGMGLVIVAPLGYQELLAIDIASIDTQAIFALLYVATATSAFAYFLNVKALRHVSSALVGYYIYLQPLFAGLIEVFIGRQVLTFEILVSTGLIFLGVFLVSKKA